VERKITLAGVKIENLTKVYKKGDEPVSKNIHLDIQDGEFFILLGPSGCGKSTLLRMIAGLERATDGRIEIGGRCVDSPGKGQFVEPKNRDIAMVFQSYALYPHMTVYQNMGFGLKLRKVDKSLIDKRVRESAEVLGLSPYLKRLPKELSGGQRQRVAVGRALVREPSVFLLDEPLSNLDAKLRGNMRVELKSLQASLNTTMIYVTHDQVEAMTLGDRVAVFNEGELQQVGTPLEIYERPINRFVASFLGSPPMNFFPGQLSAKTTLKINSQQSYFLPERFKECLLGEEDIEMGIRPEDLIVDRPNAGAIKGTVEVVEALGDHTDVHVRLNGADRKSPLIIARGDKHTIPKRGDFVSLIPRPQAIHVFSKKTGQNLSRELVCA
jgi:multiple sugar transport system ATP-binding protein